MSMLLVPDDVEACRLERLARLDVMDTEADPVLDRLTSLAASLTGSTTALVSLVDEYRQWWKSASGGLPQGGQTHRALSFCTHAIAGDDLFEVVDARLDPRFATNPLVVGYPHIVHYAGMPLKMPGGERLGTLCVINHEARTLSLSSRAALTDLAELVVEIFLLRERDQHSAKLLAAEEARRASYRQLQALADWMPQMLWSAAPDGVAVYYNERWRRFTGVDLAASKGRAWQELAHVQDRKELLERWQLCVGTGEHFEMECRLKHVSHDHRWVLARALPVRDEQGSIEHWIGTCTDIHAQRTEQDHLKNMDRRKDEFLVTLAHELRNPLAPIASGAKILGLSADPTARRIGSIMARQSSQMEGLVDDLLDISRVTRGLVELERVALDLRQVVRGAMEQVTPLLDAKQHRVELALGDLPLPVQGDAHRLTQVIANLINNAAKYTPDKGFIEVRAWMSSESKTVYAEIRDNGQGIDPQYLPHVFELFSQAAEPSAERVNSGLGLGLALVRSLMELHGGSVKVASAGKGQGATFTLVFPPDGCELKTLP